jgi:hypothetical protein
MARRNIQGKAQDNDDPRAYQALALPEQALEGGGTEILRLGVIDSELYVAALPAFEAPARWGEVLAEVARRLAAIYAVQKPGLSRKDATVEIVEAFAAEMGAQPVNGTETGAGSRAKLRTKPRATTNAKTNAKTKSRGGAKKAARSAKRKTR